MRKTLFRMAVVVMALLCVGGAGSALAHPLARAKRHAHHGGPLSGTWSGFVSRQTSYGQQRTHIVITINARQTAGSWSLGPACYGKLTLDSISGGYHHYLRHIARGLSCAGGDIDCLMRSGAGLYDAVTSHLGGGWDTSGTLKRVRRRARR